MDKTSGHACHLLTRNEKAIIVYIVVSIVIYNIRYIVISAKRKEDAFWVILNYGTLVSRILKNYLAWVKYIGLKYKEVKKAWE